MIAGYRMRRHEVWSQNYRYRAYLRDAPEDELIERSQQIMHNLLNISDDGKLSLHNDPDDGEMWEKWTHVRDELARRGVDFMGKQLMDDQMFARVQRRASPPGLKLLRGKPLPDKPYLVRLGERQHILDAFRFGRLRIAPASAYADASLNPAIRDEELTVTATRSGTETTVSFADPVTGEAGPPLDIVGNVSISVTRPANFFVMCMSDRYQTRLLDDFGYDSALIIHNKTRFLKRLKKAVAAARPDLSMRSGSVIYYDPYTVQPSHADPCFSKHFKYRYQREFRVIWERPDLGFTEGAFFVELGTLRDVASIHVPSHGS